MQVFQMISLLSKMSQDAEIICGETPFTMWVATNKNGTKHLEAMFIGIKGSCPIYNDMSKTSNNAE
jgi:hypothetical protein